MIIGFGHQSRVGKDTCCKHLVEQYGFKHYAFADQLKASAFAIYGHLGIREAQYYEDNPNSRKDIIPELGCTVVDVWVHMNKMRDIYPGIWISHLQRAIEANGDEDSDICISDVRQTNESLWIQVIMDGFLVKVTRDTPEIPGAKTDDKLSSFTGWDTHIHNDGSIDDLRENVDTALAILKHQQEKALCQ